MFRKSRNYHLNRIILLFSVIFSLIVPLINISLNGLHAKDIAQNNYFNNAINIINAVSGQAIESSRDLYNYINISFFFISIYLIITVFLLGRFCHNLYAIIYQSNFSNMALYRGKKIALLDKKVSPFSFFQTIYISGETLRNGEIDNDLVLHEAAHVSQLHSLDILLLEFIQIFYWFNPFVYLFKKLIKINHEFLADEFVIKSGSDKIDYSNKLINHTFRNKPLNLASGFNYSLIKNRLIMLSKYEQKKGSAYRLVLFIPVVVMLFLTTAFTSTNSAIQTTTAKEVSDIKSNQDSGTIYATKLFWSGKDSTIYLEGRVKINYEGSQTSALWGYLSFLKVNLLIINGKPGTLNSTIRLGKNCNVIQLTKEEAMKKYGEKGNLGAVEITSIK